MEWVAPLVGVFGVLVGATMTAWNNRRTERRALAREGIVAARIVMLELDLIQDTVLRALELGRWGPVLDPGLPYARGLFLPMQRGWRPEHSHWLVGRVAIARELSPDAWRDARRPFDLIDRIPLECWTDNADRSLDADGGREILSEISSAVPAARMSLVGLAGRRT